MRKQSLVVSICIHCLAAVAGFWLGSRIPSRASLPLQPVKVVPLRTPRDLLMKYRAEGGGGQRMPLPATRGQAPSKAARVFVLPMVPVNENPKLVMQPALLEEPTINIKSSVIGDPLGADGGPSSGGPGRRGIGSGECCGIGPGEGSKLGWNPPVATIRRYSRHPEVLTKKEPEFTEEARKARHQGSVVLAVEVWADGKAHNIRVVRGLGLGLDERAMEAVAEWRFRPAVMDGKPANAPATIEVFFRLL